MSEQATMTDTEAEAGARRSYALANDVLAMLRPKLKGSEVGLTDALYGLSLALGGLIGRIASDQEHLDKGIKITTNHIAKVARETFDQHAAEDVARLLCSQSEGNA